MGKGKFHTNCHHRGARSIPAAPAAAILPMKPMPINNQGSRSKLRAHKSWWTICGRGCGSLSITPWHSTDSPVMSGGLYSYPVHADRLASRSPHAGCPRASWRGCQAVCLGGHLIRPLLILNGASTKAWPATPSTSGLRSTPYQAYRIDHLGPPEISTPSRVETLARTVPRWTRDTTLHQTLRGVRVVPHVVDLKNLILRQSTSKENL